MTTVPPDNQTKDWFDKHAERYKAARPDYPEELFHFLASQTSEHSLAIDCGAGNGQATVRLAPYYEKVVGLEIGENQLAHAARAKNVSYMLSGTSKLPFENNSADLITAAAAVHWFELDKFYPEADRVLKPGGVLAVWTYYFPEVDPQIDKLVKDFFEVTLGENMDQRRQWIVNRYEDLPFPYANKEKKNFNYSIEGDFNRFAAVLESSSLVRQKIDATGQNPLDGIRGKLKELWGGEHTSRKMTWENRMFIGRKASQAL